MGRGGARGKGGGGGKAAASKGTLKSPHAGTGNGGTLGALHDRYWAGETAKERAQILNDFVRERMTPGTTPQQMHHMDHPEHLHRLTVDGVDYHFPAVGKTPELTESGAFKNPLLSTLAHFLHRPELKIPGNLLSATRSVIFSAHENPRQEASRKKYNNPNHVTAATAGGGHVSVYGGRDMNPGTFAHEAAHNFAERRYGTSHPPARSGFARAAASGEHHPSNYAKNNIAEDFAESVRFYHADPHGFRATHPQRHAVVHRLLSGP